MNMPKIWGLQKSHQGCDSGPGEISGSASELPVQNPAGLKCGVHSENIILLVSGTHECGDTYAGFFIIA